MADLADSGRCYMEADGQGGIAAKAEPFFDGVEQLIGMEVGVFGRSVCHHIRLKVEIGLERLAMSK